MKISFYIIYKATSNNRILLSLNDNKINLLRFYLLRKVPSESKPKP